VGGDARIDALAHGGSSNRPVNATPDGDLVVAPAQTSFLAVGHSAFVVQNPGTTSLFHSSNGAYFESGFGLALNGAEAQVDLPQGAVIRSMTFYYIDDDASGGLSAGLSRRNFDGSADVDVASAFLDADSAALQSIVFVDINHTVDMAAGFYRLFVFGGDNDEIRFLGFRIAYDL
jgi:hypothetical protein